MKNDTVNDKGSLVIIMNGRMNNGEIHSYHFSLNMEVHGISLSLLDNKKETKQSK